MRDDQARTVKVAGLVRGDVPVVILRRRYFQRVILVGVRRRLIRGRSLVFRLIVVGRLAPGNERDVLTLATRRVMLDLVHRVQRWARLRIVFAGGIRLRSAVRIPTTSGDGAAGRYVAIYYLAVSILVIDRVMKDFAALAR